MIVGNGLIANTIKPCDKKDIILFASGVSNSVNPTQNDFKREERLLLKHLKSQKTLFYFSTISVFDDSVNHSDYIEHKLRMEELIKSTSDRHLILRLPNIIGENGNPNTLFPYFKKCLERGLPVEIKEDAHRYLLSTNQLCAMLKELLENDLTNTTVNCVFRHPYKVIDIYLALAQLLNVLPLHTLVAGGLHYEVSSDFDFKIEEPKDLKTLIQSEVLQPIN